jgi:hypothetical protein
MLMSAKALEMCKRFRHNILAGKKNGGRNSRNLNKDMIKLSKPILLGIAGLACGALSGRASITYDYSYTFGDGTVVSGTLDGTQNGDYVDNVNDVTVNFNGIPISGTVFSYKANTDLAPIVSFDVTLSDFIFINSDIPNGGSYSGSEYFYILTDGPSYQLGNIAGGDNPGIQAHWSLTPETTTSPVPEPTTLLTGALTCLPFAASAVRRLRKKA